MGPGVWDDSWWLFGCVVPLNDGDGCSNSTRPTIICVVGFVGGGGIVVGRNVFNWDDAL